MAADIASLLGALGANGVAIPIIVATNRPGTSLKLLQALGSIFRS
jgi:hypothetical protein